MKPKQLTLLKEKKYAARKTARLICVRGANHVIMKSRLPILRARHPLIKFLTQETETRFQVQIKASAIMENHCHFLIKTPSRQAFANALRFLAGQIALKLGRGKLWMQRVWSRVVRAGRDYLLVSKYIEFNPVKAGIFCEIDLHLKQ